MERRGFLKTVGGMFSGAVLVPFVPIGKLAAAKGDEPSKIAVYQPAEVPSAGLDPYVAKVRQYFARRYPKNPGEGRIGFDMKRAQFQVFHDGRWVGMTEPVV